MDILFSDYKAIARSLRLRRRTATSIEARPGTQIHGLRGQLWITQEGDARDYFVPAGMRFCANRAGHIVVSALTHAAYASVSWEESEDAGILPQNLVRIDYDWVERIKAEARKARSRELVRVTRNTSRSLRSAWRWVISRFRFSRRSTEQVGGCAQNAARHHA